MGDDRGSATIPAALLSAALVVLAALLVQLGSAVLARQRAAGAADLAALAAAAHASSGEVAACARAARVVQRMQAVLEKCSLRNSHARIVVNVPVPGLAPGFPPASSRAHAGPVETAVDSAAMSGR